MYRLVISGFLGLLMASSANAAPNCSLDLVLRPLPTTPTAVSPIASELYSRSSQLGMPSGVLTQGVDTAESMDRVFRRLTIEECANIANIPSTAGTTVRPDDPAAYKPRTEYDNTPWRFDMTQNGRRMTADEFDAWMRAKGIRVARGQPAQTADAGGTVAADANAK